MSRPTYETQADVDAQDEVARLLEVAASCKLVRLRQYSRVDYLAHRDGKCIACVEIKCRHTPMSEKHPGYWLSADKWVNVRMCADALTVVGLLVVRWVDGAISSLNLNDVEPLDFAMFGRTDRDDPKDLEPCVLLPLARFQPLRGPA